MEIETLRALMARRRAFWKLLLAPIRELRGLPADEYDAQGCYRVEEDERAVFDAQGRYLGLRLGTKSEQGGSDGAARPSRDED